MNLASFQPIVSQHHPPGYQQPGHQSVGHQQPGHQQSGYQPRHPQGPPGHPQGRPPGPPRHPQGPPGPSSNVLKRPILVYSSKCKWSMLFIKMIQRDAKLFNSFVKLCIDPDPRTRERPKDFYAIQQLIRRKITDVPTIIVDNGKSMYFGQTAFVWLDHQLRVLNIKIEGFNSFEMSSFSDSYSKFGSTKIDDAASQGYVSVEKNRRTGSINWTNIGRIKTAQEQDNSGVSDSDYTRAMSQREAFTDSYGSRKNIGEIDRDTIGYDKVSDGQYNDLLRQRDTMNGPRKPQHEIDFTDNSMFYANQIDDYRTQSKGGGKSSDIMEQRLLELQQEYTSGPGPGGGGGSVSTAEQERARRFFETGE